MNAKKSVVSTKKTSRTLLFKPVQVGSLEVSGRLWMPPMCMYSAPSSGPQLGRPTLFHAIHYGSHALGGVNAVIVEATAIVPQGRISTNCLSLHSDDQIPAFRKVTSAIHEGGAAAFIQLNHAGRKGSQLPGWRGGIATSADGGWQPVAPSAIAFDDASPVPRELTSAEISALVIAFADAARRAIEAGFDGVQIHGAHGYLISQFLSPATNQRRDEWGGDFEGRTRFIREVAREVRSAVGAAPVLLRISGTDWTQEYPNDARPGWTLDETCRLVPLLVEDGISMINASTGGNIPDAKVPAGPGYQVFVADAIKKVVVDHTIPVSACGLILAPEQAEQILLDGRADVIEIGRTLLADPMAPHVWRSRLRVESAVPVQYQRGTRR